MTKQRRVILEELCKVTSHPTADELFLMVRKRQPGISLGTVYRNLDRLVADGKVLRLVTASGKMRFDGKPGKHYHIRCERCGRIDDISLDYDPGIDRNLADSTGYEILGHSLEFAGVCPACKGKNDVIDE